MVKKNQQKTTTINLKNSDDKCFQYAITVALNHEQIKSLPERISNNKPFINQYNWKEIHLPPHKNEWKRFESNNQSVALNILYVPYNTKEIRHAYISKHNPTRENQGILFMIIDGEKWHYLAVKKLSASFCKITSKHDGDLYCLNCLNSFSTENKLKEHENVCKNHNHCYIEMPKEESILKYNHGEKPMKTPFII